MAFAPEIALEYLQRAHASDRLGHAYLLIGGDSALVLARQVAALVVHADPAEVTRHPDVHLVEPESKSRRIIIEQMRELENALRLRAAIGGGRKVGIVREADRLQPQASHAFLKTLEEPPAQSLLLLLTALPESLPDTILSRCIRVVLREDAVVPGGATDLPEEAALRDLLARQARERPVSGAPSVAAGYLFLREFTQLLDAARARLQAETEAALKAEEAQYKQTTDGSWLGEREAYYKGVTEARYVAARGRLLDVLARWWGEVLRRQTTGPAGERTTSPQVGAATTASGLSTPAILRRLTALEELRENLERNIQEALALEVAFLQVFGS